MNTQYKVNNLSTEAQKVIRNRAAVLADVGQELIFVETGVGYWKPYFYNTCLEYALDEYQQQQVAKKIREGAA